MTVKSNRKPNGEDRKRYLEIVRAQGLESLVVRVGDDEYVFTLEQRDAEGRTLLMD